MFALSSETGAKVSVSTESTNGQRIRVPIDPRYSHSNDVSFPVSVATENLTAYPGAIDLWPYYKRQPFQWEK